MKIALVQMDCEDELWAERSLPGLLQQAAECDLVVFPECMPFARTKRHEDAVRVLEATGQQFPDAAFIAGGYVKDGEHTFNRVYLVHQGKVKNHYDKQRRWPGEKFTPGNEATLFEWDDKRCIPLICADAGDRLSPNKIKMMAAAIAAGAGPDTPIVVCSYGGGLMTDYWQPALTEWSQGCNAPLVICGIAGTHTKECYEDTRGLTHWFGGGGSGVFWQSGYQLQSPAEGIVIVDLRKRSLLRKEILRATSKSEKK